MMFKKGDCIYHNNLYGIIISVHEIPNMYKVTWYDSRPETTYENFDHIDSYGFSKISECKLFTLVL